jgi:hypothetical protein
MKGGEFLGLLNYTFSRKTLLYGIRFFTKILYVFIVSDTEVPRSHSPKNTVWPV